MSDTAPIEMPPPIPPEVPSPPRRAPAVVFGVTGVGFLISAAIFALPVPGRPSPPTFARPMGGAVSLRGVAAAGGVSPGTAATPPSAVRQTDRVRLRVGETHAVSPRLRALPPPSPAQPRVASSSRAAGPTCQGMLESQRWDDAITLCTKEAAAGKASAQRDLGELFERGRGVKKDGSAALEWYTRAASAGLAEAQFAVGRAYEKGKLGARKDKITAMEWYRKAAAQGHQKAIARMKDLSR